MCPEREKMTETSLVAYRIDDRLEVTARGFFGTCHCLSGNLSVVRVNTVRLKVGLPHVS